MEKLLLLTVFNLSFLAFSFSQDCKECPPVKQVIIDCEKVILGSYNNEHKYNWYRPTGELFSVKNKVEIEEEGFYTVEIIRPNGCIETKDFEVILKEISTIPTSCESREMNFLEALGMIHKSINRV